MTDLRLPPNVRKAVAATLVDHFKVSLDAFARLTDRQIREIYMHKRTKEGEIDVKTADVKAANEICAVEEEAPTLEGELRNLDLLASLVRMPPGDVDKAREQLRRKFAK